MQMKRGFTRNSDILMKIYEELLAYKLQMQRKNGHMKKVL